MRQTFSCENNLAGVAALLAQALKFLAEQKLSSRALFLSELAMEEMLTNTVKYGYDDDEVHYLEVFAEIQSGRVTLQLRDDGHYFDPSQAPPPHTGGPLSTRALGGSGISLMRRMMERFEYRREGDLNVVVLSFPSGASDSAPRG